MGTLPIFFAKTPPLPTMKLPRFIAFASFLVSQAAALAYTYPPTSDFKWGNSAVNQPAQNSAVTGTGLPYRLLLPRNYSSSIKYPVVIFLHGQGESGTDNVKQLNSGANGAMSIVSTASPDNQALFPCIFVAPQTNNDWKTMGPKIGDIINTLKTQYSVDEDRITLTGLSMGALGSWLIVKALPNTFNCLVPLSGGGGTSDLEKLPVWAFHAENDNTVGANGTDNAISTLRSRGIPVLYTRYTTGDHNIWSKSYQLPELVPWISVQRRGQPIQGTPALRVLTTSQGTSPLKVTGTTVLPSTMSATRVGWCRSNNGGVTAGDDGITNGTTTFVSGTANFLSTSLAGYRIVIRKDIAGATSGFYYDITSVTSATSLILDRTSSASANRSYSLYKPGTYTNLNPSPGTTTDNWKTWSVDVPLSGSTQIVQIIAELALSTSTLGGRTTYNYPINITNASPTGDTVAPTISVVSPVIDPATVFTSVAPSVTIAGSASDNVGVTSVTWINDRGPSGVASGSASWAITDLPLSAGPNTITIAAKDAKNNAGTIYLLINYNPPAGTDTVAPSIAITSPTASGAYTSTTSTINLSGTASDNAGLASVTWTNATLNTSGPAVGTSNWSANSLSLAAGTNVISVKAADLSGNTATASITVTYNATPVNQAPVVSAGSDQTITLPATATLSGSVTDDGLPSSTVTKSWSTVSGPGTVIFSDTTSLTPTAAFSVAGGYVLRLTANDGALSASDDVNVTVKPVSTGSTSTTQQLNFDFGVTTQTTTATGWNNITGFTVGSGTTDCKDSTGASTGIGLSVTQAFQSSVDNGASSPSTPYPQTAMRDCFYSQNTPAKLKFTGLDPTGTYKVTIFGYRNATATDRVSKYTIGTQVLTLNASQNTSNTAVFTGAAPAADGSMEVIVDRDTGSTFGYLNVLVLEKESAPPPSLPAAILQGATLRVAHGGAGTFGKTLTLTGQPTIESRLPAAGNYTMVFTFDKAVASAAAAINGTGMLQGDPTASGNTITVGVVGATNRQTLRIDLTNIAAADGGKAGTASASFTILKGDVNATSNVNTTDLLLLKSKGTRAADNSNCSFDIDANGTIDAADTEAMKAALGTQTP